MKTIDRSTLHNTVGGLDIDYDDIRMDYSGRGMYGKSCLGIVCENEAGTAAQLAVAIREEMDRTDDDDLMRELEDWLNAIMYDTYSDSMGRNSIIYWPGIQVDE